MFLYRERKQSLANLSVTLDPKDVESLPDYTNRDGYQRSSPSLSMCSEIEQAGESSSSSESCSLRSDDSNTATTGQELDSGSAISVISNRPLRSQSLANLGVNLDSKDTKSFWDVTTRDVHPHSSPSLNISSEAEEASVNTTSSKSDSPRCKDDYPVTTGLEIDPGSEKPVNYNRPLRRLSLSNLNTTVDIKSVESFLNDASRDVNQRSCPPLSICSAIEQGGDSSTCSETCSLRSNDSDTNITRCEIDNSSAESLDYKNR